MRSCLVLASWGHGGFGEERRSQGLELIGLNHLTAAVVPAVAADAVGQMTLAAVGASNKRSWFDGVVSAAAIAAALGYLPFWKRRHDWSLLELAKVCLPVGRPVHYSRLPSAVKIGGVSAEGSSLRLVRVVVLTQLRWGGTERRMGVGGPAGAMCPFSPRWTGSYAPPSELSV